MLRQLYSASYKFVFTIADMYDRLWGFPGTHTPQIQQIFTAQQPPLQPQVIGTTASNIGVSYPQPYQTLVNK